MRDRASYACVQCEYRSAKWLGRCPRCGAWGTLVERDAGVKPVKPMRRAGPGAEPLELGRVRAGETDRLPSGVGELDRVLGGGLVPGGVVLIGGEPGIGKSTLLLQAAASLDAAEHRVLYVSGEESAAQLRLRAERLGLAGSDLLVLAETDVDSIVDTARGLAPAVVVVDSVQALRCRDLDSVPGSVGQVREGATRFVEFAKASATPVVLVGHVTKEGAIAGPRTLEHLVDAVIQFEGDRHHAHRLLRALKNRFGPTDELGVFRMEDAGLVEVADPSELFVVRRPEQTPGSTVLPALVGSRPLLVEIQALVGEPVQGSPRRTALGVDAPRLAMVLAVLQRRMGTELWNRDVFANAAGGATVTEPAADLAIAAAVASSARGRALPERCVVLGEIGLTGEIRPVSRVDVRLREAARLGYTTAVIPHGTPTGRHEIEPVGVATVEQALHRLFG